LDSHYSLLEQEALLHIAGPDTLTFLQGQTTCDTAQVGEQRGVLGAYCTPQGRVVCDFLLAQLAPEHFALRMRRDIRDHAAQVFGKYIVFSKAELDATRDDWLVLGIWGADAAAALADIFGAAPGAAWERSAGEDHVLLCSDDRGAQFELLLATDSPRRAALDEVMQQAPESAWRERQIAAGVARIEAATVEQFVPQVLNYDLTGHISFSKGCYTGQEVVARLHYRGKSKRRTHLAQLPAGHAAAAGAPLYSAGGEQAVGDVVNSAGALALVSATHEAVATGLHLEGPAGPALTLGELPYAIAAD